MGDLAILADVARHEVRPDPDAAPALERDDEARHSGEVVFPPGEEGGLGPGGGRTHELVEVGHVGNSSVGRQTCARRRMEGGKTLMKGGNRFIKGFIKEVANEFPVESAKALCGI